MRSWIMRDGGEGAPIQVQQKPERRGFFRRLFGG
jgi:hypothetical protein